MQWMGEDRLAFECGETPENTTEFREWSMLCVVNVDGSALTVLHRAQSEQDTVILGPLALSPDRRRVAFVRSGGVDFRGHLMISELGETAEEDLGPVGREDRGPAEMGDLEWSPDGSRILESMVESTAVHERNTIVRVFDLACACSTWRARVRPGVRVFDLACACSTWTAAKRLMSLAKAGSLRGRRTAQGLRYRKGT